MAQTKKPASRAVVGNTKKTKGFRLSKRGFLLGLIAVVAFSVAGGIGWQQWQDNQVEAKAAGYKYTTVGNWGNGSTLKACKEAITSGYGPLWKIHLIATNPKNTTDKISYGFYIERGSSLVSTTNFNSLSAGVSVSKVAYASRIQGDTYSVSVGDGGKGGGGPFSGMQSYSTIKNCTN